MIDELSSDDIRAVLSNLFSLGNVETFSEALRVLHHEFLRLTISPEPATPIAEDDLLRLQRIANALATHYTNPFAEERAFELPSEERTDPRVLQDGRGLAATIFEFLADYTSLASPSSMEGASLTALRPERSLPPAARLYLKAAIMYGLGSLEARTAVLLRRLADRFTPADFSLESNALRLADWFILNLLAGEHRRIRDSRHSDSRAIARQREHVMAMIDSADLDSAEDAYEGYVRQIVSLDLISGSVAIARAFLLGDERSMASGTKCLGQALSFAELLREPETIWTIRSASKLVERMWRNSPWLRLAKSITNRRYLRSLANSGISTLWASQITALEMSSSLHDLRGGYLDDRLRRVVLTMPTSAGKTLLCELAIVKTLVDTPSRKCVYVAPTRALCDQVTARLRDALAPMGIRVAAPVSDNDQVSYETLIYQEVNVVVVTPEKLSYLYRQVSPAIRDADLIIFDEVHMIAKADRGWTYEEIITILLADPRSAQAKMIFVSAVMPNHVAFRQWVDPLGTAQSVSSAWQPTRVLKGALVFSPPKLGSAEMHATISGDVVYVRSSSELSSALRIRGIVESKQMLEWLTAANGYRYRKRIERLSDGYIEHAARLALAFSRLGPVLIFAPKRFAAEQIAETVSEARGLDEARMASEAQGDAISFVRDVLSEAHPLVQMLPRGVAYHHGNLTREVRGEVEFLFKTRFTDILVATQTLIDGVNFPVKTLIIADYCVNRRYDKQTKKMIAQHPLDKRDFRNMVGRAGRAFAETEGQVIVIQSVEEYPFALERGFTGYLDINQSDPALAITSSLEANDGLELLRELVEAFEAETLSPESIVLETSALPRRLKELTPLMRKLAALTILLESGDITPDAAADRFGTVFARTFIGVQRREAAAAECLAGFAQHVARATSVKIGPELKLLFSRTGLPLSVCFSLYSATRAFWEQQLTNGLIVAAPLARLLIRSIAAIVYKAGARGGLGPTRVRPRALGEGSRSGVAVPYPEELLLTWMETGSATTVIETHLGFCESPELRATAFSDYLQETLNFSTPWLLSAFWLFSREHCAALDVDLGSAELGRDLMLFPAYAKFGTLSPFVAFASTLGIGPNRTVRLLADHFAIERPLAGRHDYPSMFAWLTALEPERMSEYGIERASVRRIVDRLGGISTATVPPDDAWGRLFTIAGWQYYEGPRIADQLAPGGLVSLVREPENPYDPNAIAVLLPDGRRLGYVPRSMAPEIGHSLLASDVAEIHEIRNSVNPSERILVRLRRAEIDE